MRGLRRNLICLQRILGFEDTRRWAARRTGRTRQRAAPMTAIQGPGAAYPTRFAERTAWILQHRGPRSAVDSSQPARAISEQECGADGRILAVNALFLTNRECPWRCLMCDLWRHTTERPVPPKAIPQQIAGALQHLPSADVIKLYNAGSFFDRHAIPSEDHPTIAEQCRPFSLVVVESHPTLVGDSVLRFRDRLHTRLEVAMGLETIHPRVLPRLNKRMTLGTFERAARLLRSEDIGLRTFVLLRPPFLTESEGLEWAVRSIEFAQICGATVVVLIPTRAGNGAIEALQAMGEFALPRLETLEQALAAGIDLKRGRVFADLWDLDGFSRCSVCYPQRVARLREMNLCQETPASIVCDRCA